MSKKPEFKEGYSDIQGKLWKVWYAEILSIETKIAQTFNADQRKEHKALDSALKSGLIRTTDPVTLIVVKSLEKIQVILDWKTKWEKKPKVGSKHIMFYGRWGYTFPEIDFKIKLEAGLQYE